MQIRTCSLATTNRCPTLLWYCPWLQKREGWMEGGRQGEWERGVRSSEHFHNNEHYLAMDTTVFVIKAMKSHQMCEADTFQTKCVTVWMFDTALNTFSFIKWILANAIPKRAEMVCACMPMFVCMSMRTEAEGWDMHLTLCKHVFSIFFKWKGGGMCRGGEHAYIGWGMRYAFNIVQTCIQHFL